MRFGSVCSGMGAAEHAWQGLGWECSFMSEIEQAQRAVLQHHYPDTPLHGDFTTIEAGQYDPIDLLVGGTPCQSFSIAGLRKGLSDDRGNLALEFLRLADRLQPQWIVWENVPGVLSSTSHDAPDPCPPPPPVDLECDEQEMGTEDEYSSEELHAFNSFLAGLSELGYGWSYRIFDAQYTRVDGFDYAVPQRRRRVFVVGHLMDWRRAAAVLFDREGMSWNPPPRRESGQKAAPTLSARTKGGGGLGTDFELDGGLIASTGDVYHCLNAGGMGRQDYETETLIAVHGTQNPITSTDVAFPVQGNQGQETCIAIQERAASENPDAGPDGKGWRDDGAAYTLEARTTTQAVATPWAVRRLMPVECERLQGFPDDYTLVPYRGRMMADGPRYKMIGNSMAVNVMTHIGRRIQAVEDLGILPSQRDLSLRDSAL